MPEEKKELEKKEEVKVDEKVVEKAEVTINEDELNKAIKSLEEIVKARKVEEVEEEEEEDEDAEQEKSYSANFGEDETLEKAIEVSDFLQALVDQTETSVDALGKTVNFLQKSMEKFDNGYIESLKKLGEIVKGSVDTLSKKLDGFDERMKNIEQTPIAPAPKSIRKAAEPIQKSFASGEQAEGIDGLGKRQIVDLLEKAVADGKVRDTVLFSFEGSPTFNLAAETKEILKAYLPK